ncbi:MAG: hypothetical protein LBN24_10325 [Mediterranea sp.]|nr:hypothetical protein [Mediterranea sp.]
MKKQMWIFGIVIALMSGTNAKAAMSLSQISENARFLSDKMGYELALNNQQYNDVYEINYNFIYSVQDYLDDLALSYSWASDAYYHALDLRNDDLRWVLTAAQYSRFLQTDYFYRPLYRTGNTWAFGVYLNYPNRNLFFMGLPTLYYTYRGAHIRKSFSSSSYYRGRYPNRNPYQGSYLLRPNRPNRPSTVPSRPNTRPSTRPSTTTPSRPSTTAPSRPSTTAPSRPSTTAPSRPSTTTPNRRPSTTTPSRPSTTTPSRRPSTTTPSRPSTTVRSSASTSRDRSASTSANRSENHSRQSSGSSTRSR